MGVLMKNIELLLLCVACSQLCCCQQPLQRDSIKYWSKREPLSFADFEAQPAFKDTGAVMVSDKLRTHKLGAIVTSIDVQVNRGEKSTTFTIRAAMLTTSSWLKNKSDSILLKHEQGHFDICEIHTRLLRKAMRNARSMREARQLWEDAMAKEELEQLAFDVDNTYEAGGITPGWLASITNRLNQLNAYQNSKLVLAIAK